MNQFHREASGSRAKPLPSQEVLHQLLDYDPSTGRFTWKERDASWPGHHGFNAKCAGKPAFANLQWHGGLKGQLLKDWYYAHRVAFKWVHGTEPEQIDHINGDRADNRISNLRASNYTENSKNKACYSNNRCGHANIRLKDNGRWRVGFKSGGRKVYDRTFATLDEAIVARNEMRARLGFHPNHGRVA